MVAPIERRPWISVAVLCLAAGLAAGCSGAVADGSACANLTYTDGGVARKDYLPCAGEMIAGLDDVATRSQAAFRGDQNARDEGQAALRRVQALMNAAGGRKLLERWPDTALTDLNLDISNAVTKYQAFYMVRIVDGAFAAKSREAADAELQGATRRYDEARSLYRRLR